MHLKEAKQHDQAIPSINGNEITQNNKFDIDAVVFK